MMKTGGFSVSFAVFFLFCNNAKEKTQPTIALDEYMGLKVGNSWEYIVVKYELAGTPDSNYQFVAMDSIVQTKSIAAHRDSRWYYTIKDSLYFRWRCREPKSGYLDTPVVTAYSDTCIRNSKALKCRQCDYNSLNLDSTSHDLTDSIIEGDTSYPYFWTKLGPPVHFVFYAKNIGLAMYGYETTGNLQGYGETVSLKKFNGFENNVVHVISNYRIKESYTFKRCTLQ